MSLKKLQMQTLRTLGVLPAMYRGAEHDTGLKVALPLANEASLEVRDGPNVRCIVPLALTAIRQTLELSVY